MHSSCPSCPKTSQVTAQEHPQLPHAPHAAPPLPYITGIGEISAIPLTMHPSGRASVKLKAFFLASVVS